MGCRIRTWENISDLVKVSLGPSNSVCLGVGEKVTHIAVCAVFPGFCGFEWGVISQEILTLPFCGMQAPQMYCFCPLLRVSDNYCTNHPTTHKHSLPHPPQENSLWDRNSVSC